MTIRWRITLEKPRINKKVWLQKLTSEMEVLFEQALLAWLTAATAPIPSWSGASLGTFSDLASRLNFVLRISPTPLGRRLGLGVAAGRAKSKGTIDINKKQGLFRATYSTSLEHLVFNEFNNADLGGDPNVFSKLRHRTPYNFLGKGNKAFQEVVAAGTLPSQVPLTVKKVTLQ